MTTQHLFPVLMKPQHPFLVGLLVGPLFFLLDLVDRAIEHAALKFIIQIVLLLPLAYIFLISVLGYIRSHHDSGETAREALVAVAKNVGLWLFGGLISTAALAFLIYAASKV